MTDAFSYSEAFSRNVGWVTEAEQDLLKGKAVAIAGMGGVGGVHLLTLARLGIGRFHIADFDKFGLVNFNRQAGALVSTIGQPKVEVLRRMALEINPQLQIEAFPEGVTPANVTAFLSGTDAYVDGLDFFAFDARAMTFRRCAELGIPAITAAPLGMGTALLNFLPGGMTFEDYFQWGDRSETEKALRFMIGLSPRLLQDYIADASKVDLELRRGPSTIMGCQLCAGVAATEVLKIILKRGAVRGAPHGLHFDAYRQRMVRTWRPGGNRHPLQQLLLAFARWRLSRMRKGTAR